mmetsp:Transcript_54005/g.157667  ORF Transcript_54005/g.157667 Transcript_54005/m.157667 type:complete len:227 (+) Transcript_54005:263-943(+)
MRRSSVNSVAVCQTRKSLAALSPALQDWLSRSSEPEQSLDPSAAEALSASCRHWSSGSSPAPLGCAASGSSSLPSSSAPAAGASQPWQRRRRPGGAGSISGTEGEWREGYLTPSPMGPPTGAHHSSGLAPMTDLMFSKKPRSYKEPDASSSLPAESFSLIISQNSMVVMFLARSQKWKREKGMRMEDKSSVSPSAPISRNVVSAGSMACARSCTMLTPRSAQAPLA